jgi:hypothetical protein
MEATPIIFLYEEENERKIQINYTARNAYYQAALAPDSPTTINEGDQSYQLYTIKITEGGNSHLTNALTLQGLAHGDHISIEGALPFAATDTKPVGGPVKGNPVSKGKTIIIFEEDPGSLPNRS